MVFRYFSSSSLTVPKARTTIGVIVVLTSHNFYTCYLKSWYLVIFSSSFTFMFCSPGTAMAMILHSLFCLSVNTVSGLWCSISLSVWIAKSQSMLHMSFSSTGSGWCENHLSWNSIVFNLIQFLAQEPVYFFPSLSCLFLYWFPAMTEHELTIWVTLSILSLQSRHSEDTSWWSMSVFISFLLSACFWATHIGLSVSRFSSPAFSHRHLLYSCVPSVSLRNWPCNAFSFHAASLSFSHLSLSFPSIFVLRCNSSAAAFRSLSLFFVA